MATLSERIQRAATEQRVPIPDFGEHMNVREFIKSVEDLVLTDNDGFADLATATERVRVTVTTSMFKNSSLALDLMLSAGWTHVVWYEGIGRLNR